ncbi:hypothetical protein F4561_005194 [Lipingzhangella halophila]|uniref:Uncharacterized protein n=1 Tax=Lipingzhangella halophila TaxID=1783352 RepID=A0A7W7RLW5_9ACTN|nr:hypothetical protein [Lipingzhangella halophila]MBB4934374.1 hypothetical protein [Lipingzhangella halophila]
MAREFTHEFFIDKIKPLTVALVVQAVDEDMVGRISRDCIYRWLISRARRDSSIGPVFRRVGELLNEDAAFERVPDSEPGAGRWRLAGSGLGPWHGNPGRLVDAAAAVSVTPLRPWKSQTRRSPVAGRADLVAVLTAMLTAAHGSVEISVLAHAMSQRFPAWADPFEVSLDGLAGAERAQDFREAQVEQGVMVEAEAREVFAQLSADDQKTLVQIRRRDVGEVARIFDCGRSSAYARMQDLRHRVAGLLVESEEAFGVVVRVEEMCRHAQAGADGSVSAASDHHEGTSVRSDEVGS